jgi:AraC-like DNA-binding protein
MQPFELALRSMAGLQLLCLAGVLLWRHERAAAALPIGLAAYMLTSAPGVENWIAPPWLLPLTLLCVANPLWFWLLAQAWFADRQRADWRWALPTALLVAAGWWHEAAAPGVAPAWTRAVHALGAAAVVIATCVQVLHGKAGDLVEPRRRWRSWFLLGTGAYGLAAAALLAWHGGQLPAPWARVHIGFILLASVAVNLWLATHAPTPARDEPAAAAASRQAPAVDAALVQRIREAMHVRRLYRDDQLTVAALARAVGSQEYLVRRAINGHLGFRNFHDFLNSWRLGDAASRLRGEPQRPILSIALDVGYGSVGPFNRAFRARFGMTPSEYRALESQP